MEEYAKFVVMAEDALTTNDTSKMKWMGLEYTRQQIQREMINLAYFTKESEGNPILESVRDTHYQSIQSGLTQMKDVIVELRMDNQLDNLLQKIVERTRSKSSVEPFMDAEVYQHYRSGKPMEYLTLEQKRDTYQRLKSLVVSNSKMI